MELQVGVKIALKNKEEKILLLKRSDKYPGLEGQWDIVGGRIDPGISLENNLKREVMEETSLKIIGIPQLIAAQDIISSEKHVVRLTYLGLAEGDLRLGEEHTEFGWFSRDELDKLENLDPYFRELFSKIT